MLADLSNVDIDLGFKAFRSRSRSSMVSEQDLHFAHCKRNLTKTEREAYLARFPSSASHIHKFDDSAIESLSTVCSE